MAKPCSSKIVFILTNPILYKLSQDLINQYDLNCTTTLVGLKDVEKTADAEIENGAKIIISRGYAAVRIQRHVSIKVITIKYAFSDFASAIDVASRYGNRIAMVVLSNELFRFAKREDYYWRIKTTVSRIHDIDKAHEEISKLKIEGINAIIGGMTIKRIASKLGIPGILIGSNEYSVFEAIEEAEHTLKIMHDLETRYQTISTLIDCSVNGMITLNKEGEITNINQNACKLISVKREEVLNKNYSTIFPFPDIISKTMQGKHFHNFLLEYNNSRLAVDSLPILLDNVTTGIVINIQGSEYIQDLEAKLRRQSSYKGHTAKYTFRDIIGNNEKIVNIKRRAMVFAGVDSTIMIYGSTGTGKELFAQSIHNASSRRNNAFIAVNCAAFPESLLESELFGYVKGAFTGANTEGKAGIFEMAHKGTIFLDEISEMPVSMQSHLLRVIQEREVIRIGGKSVIPVDVRIITATNKNLINEIEKGSFRRDLYYRLNVLTLQLPLLNERGSDIDALAIHFAHSFGIKYSRNITGISPQALEKLRTYHYDGNVRELSNIIERAVILTHNTELSDADILTALSDSPSSFTMQHTEVDNHTKVKEEITHSEKNLIVAALKEANGNKTKAAEIMQISRTTLWRKINKYSIETSKKESR